MDAFDAPAATCQCCGLTKHTRDLVRVNARTLWCTECVDESVAHDDEQAQPTASLGLRLLVALNTEYAAQHFDDHEALNELADRGRIEEHGLDAWADMVAGRAPELSAVGT
ncbi:MAG: hypothetical protein EKK55_02330 [Rhodocyclaceae bacterium]|nr:MAG: hypothetical protein EKK55_02330 [Rhodocyclaceae bacterium]